MAILKIYYCNTAKLIQFYLQEDDYAQQRFVPVYRIYTQERGRMEIIMADSANISISLGTGGVADNFEIDPTATKYLSDARYFQRILESAEIVTCVRNSLEESIHDFVREDRKKVLAQIETILYTDVNYHNLVGFREDMVSERLYQYIKRMYPLQQHLGIIQGITDSPFQFVGDIQQSPAAYADTRWIVCVCTNREIAETVLDNVKDELVNPTGRYNAGSCMPKHYKFLDLTSINYDIHRMADQPSAICIGIYPDTSEGNN